MLHLLGLGLVLGPILLLDLRLLGFGRAFELPALARVLTGWAVAGLLVLIASGIALFAADARALSANAVMQLKLLLVALAVSNALAFRALWKHRLGDWDRDAPGPARVQAAASILFWLAIPSAGRLIAYV